MVSFFSRCGKRKTTPPSDPESQRPKGRGKTGTTFRATSAMRKRAVCRMSLLIDFNDCIGIIAGSLDANQGVRLAIPLTI